MKPSTDNSIDRAAEAIHALRANTEDLLQLGESMTGVLSRLEENIRILRLTDRSEVLPKLLERVDRMREYRNLMELGGFVITMRNEIDAAWRRLP